MSGQTSRQLLIAKIEQAIAECNKHKKRADYALYHIKDLFPLTIEKYEQLIETEEYVMEAFNSKSITSEHAHKDSKIEYFDQFLYRYSKLQDKIATGIIKHICDLLEYKIETQSFIDYLNIAEKNCIIESVQIWDSLRTIRNNITHDYSDDFEYQVKTLNDVYMGYQELLKIFANIKSKFETIKST